MSQIFAQMERVKKYSCPGSFVIRDNTDYGDKDVDKENNDDNKLVSRAPAGLDWLQRTLRRSRSDYHQPQQQPPAQRPGRRHTSSNLIQVPTRDT